MSEGKIRQLCAFVEFEREHNPHPSGQQHIAGWAYEEIQRLTDQRDALLEGLKYIVGCSAPMTPQQKECWPVLRAAIASVEGGTS